MAPDRSKYGYPEIDIFLIYPDRGIKMHWVQKDPPHRLIFGWVPHHRRTKVKILTELEPNPP